MPVFELHLIADRHLDADVSALLQNASKLYVEILYPDMNPRPIERARAFATFHKKLHWATGGVLAAEGAADAPYFTCLTLAGRPVEQLQNLLSGMTELIVRHLGVEKAGVRGRIIPIDPAHWAIGGIAASTVRRSEVGSRIKESNGAAT